MNESTGRLGRRDFLSGVALAGITAWGLGASAIGAAATSSELRGRASANGWPVVAASAAEPLRVEGSAATLLVLPGAVSVILGHVLRRFHYEILPLGAADVRGHVAEETVGSPEESNHLSATAVAIRPDCYPLGQAGGFLPGEVAVVRDILADCDGVVRWGGDTRGTPPKEGHFQIDVPPGDPRLADIAAALTGRAAGAGSMPDPFAPGRRQRSLRLARVQGR